MATSLVETLCILVIQIWDKWSTQNVKEAIKYKCIFWEVLIIFYIWKGEFF